jgi:hypothetical protein
MHDDAAIKILLSAEPMMMRMMKYMFLGSLGAGWPARRLLSKSILLFSPFLGTQK